MGVHIGQVGLHDITGSQPENINKRENDLQRRNFWIEVVEQVCTVLSNLEKDHNSTSEKKN